jgi:hypothetical protein
MKPQPARMLQVQIPTLRAEGRCLSAPAESPFLKNLWPMSQLQRSTKHVACGISRMSLALGREKRPDRRCNVGRATGHGKETTMAKRSGLHVTAQYQREPWGYAGMEVRIYRPIAKGPKRMTRLYAMRSIRGVIATARTMDALADLARRNRWVATYRHVTQDGREVWVSVPE